MTGQPGSFGDFPVWASLIDLTTFTKITKFGQENFKTAGPNFPNYPILCVYISFGKVTSCTTSVDRVTKKK